MGGRRLDPYWLVSGGSERTESGGGMRGLVEQPAYAARGAAIIDSQQLPIAITVFLPPFPGLRRDLCPLM